MARRSHSQTRWCGDLDLEVLTMTVYVIVTPNYALERSATGLSERAAGARTIIAPAARQPRCAPPAQCGR